MFTEAVHERHKAPADAGKRRWRGCIIFLPFFSRMFSLALTSQMFYMIFSPKKQGLSLRSQIRGDVFCSFLALILRKELERRLESAGHLFEWAYIKQDIKALQETIIEENAKRLAIQTQCLGTCGKVFQTVGVAVPPTIREI